MIAFLIVFVLRLTDSIVTTVLPNDEPEGITTKLTKTITFVVSTFILICLYMFFFEAEKIKMTL